MTNLFRPRYRRPECPPDAPAAGGTGAHTARRPSPAPEATLRARTAVIRARALLSAPATRVVGLVLATVVAGFNLSRLPSVHLVPVLVALVPWVVGKYVLCPLRWHALSVSGRSRRWHLRVCAEGELLGLLTPAHAGTDLWRLHQLTRVGLDRRTALADVGLDRLVGGIGLTAFVLLAGAGLPAPVLLAGGAVAAGLLVTGVLLRRRRPDLLARRPLPPVRVLLRGLAISLVYTASTLGLLFGAVVATGHTVSPLALLGVFGASQVAGIVPGVHGAEPRDGALVAGLVALGLPFVAALGAVAIASVVAWVPGILLGGTLLLHRRLTGPPALPAAA